MLRHALLAAIALAAPAALAALGTAPASAQTAPEPLVTRVDPAATGTSAPVEMQDGSGNRVPIGTLDPITHAFVPAGQAAVQATATGAQTMSRSTIAATVFPATQIRITTTDGGLYTRGTAAGPLAIQDGGGRWWVLDVADLPAISFAVCQAVDDDRTDNTAAVQTCATIAGAAGKDLTVPAGGVYRVGGSGTITTTGSVRGDGWKSQIRNMSPTANLFQSAVREQVRFTGVHFLPGPNPPTGGAAIYIDAPVGSYSFRPLVEGNIFQGQYQDIYCNRCNVPTIDRNFSTDYIANSIVLDNVDFPDNGDQHVYDNVIDKAGRTGTAVLQYAAGGLHLWGNKIGNGSHAFQLSLRANASTSDLDVHDNSLENQSGSSVLLSRQPDATGIFVNAQIHDNQIASSVRGVPAVDIQGDGWLTSVNVHDNTVQMPADTTAFNLHGGVGVNYGANTIQSFGGTATAVDVAPGTLGTLRSDTLLGVPTACVCASSGMFYDNEQLSKIDPAPATTSNIAGDALPKGFNTIPLFEIDMAPNQSFTADVAIGGLVQRYSASFAHTRFNVYADGSRPVVSVESNTSNPALPRNKDSLQGYGLTVTQVGFTVTVSATYNAGVAGSYFSSQMRPLSGNGTFKTL